MTANVMRWWYFKKYARYSDKPRLALLSDFDLSFRQSVLNNFLCNVTDSHGLANRHLYHTKHFRSTYTIPIMVLWMHLDIQYASKVYIEQEHAYNLITDTFLYLIISQLHQWWRWWWSVCHACACAQFLQFLYCTIARQPLLCLNASSNRI